MFNQKLKLRSFKSSEQTKEKADGPYRGFRPGYLSLVIDPIDLQQGAKENTAISVFCRDINEPRREKTGFFLGEYKGADQLRNNCEADQRLCFRYTDSKILLLSKSNISCP